ncbi:hypothetical protein [Actinophytocola gossypii]|uniref:Uncharacterized protein n=1 Tax=Actinophytocola gossypii TaxID=2812003 RepID=A0ABT2J3H4_9PSEU|nr:hypothetical protein [Actinophytocola gossypii]MCT2582396.1 hypothetical protein [Actinophytocola gossypii]
MSEAGRCVAVLVSMSLLVRMVALGFALGVVVGLWVGVGGRVDGGRAPAPAPTVVTTTPPVEAGF